MNEPAERIHIALWHRKTFYCSYVFLQALVGYIFILNCYSSSSFSESIILLCRDALIQYVVYIHCCNCWSLVVRCKSPNMITASTHKSFAHFCPLPSTHSSSDICSALMFTGDVCEVQIDECQSKPCLNGGSCHDYVGGFTCTCPSGFQGHQCEINIDECQEQPCQNGALCIDGVNE